MKTFSPAGTVRERFLAADGGVGPPGPTDDGRADDEDLEASYFGWEIARCAPALPPAERRAIALLASACIAAMRAGSTRLPLGEASLRTALSLAGGADGVATVRSMIERARTASPGDPIGCVIGQPGERKPLIVDGAWLYPERMRVLEERFCARVRDRVARAAPARESRALGRVLNAVAAGPPALTEEQKRAVRESLVAPLALITGGPGTGKTTIVLALLRALASTGVPMDAIAIAAPTGKAAQRLRDTIASGLSSAPPEIAEAALRAFAPVPQTLHRLLGWSPGTGRFARHENDRLLERVVIVDEASMVDLAMMDRLVRALSDDARLVLLGDADQLPSVEAGAVFRDLCAGLGAVRLTANLRVLDDPGARRIVAAARAVNSGVGDGLAESMTTRYAVGEVSFEGVEHLAAPWADVGDALLDRWWRERVASLEGFARAVDRTYRAPAGVFDRDAAGELRSLFDHLARTRLLCATRARSAASAQAINHRLLEVHAGGRAGAGTPVLVERNDYERRLFNGDQGLVVRVEEEAGAAPLMAVFPQGNSFGAFPLGAVAHLSPAFAMTVHKAQGSEFDDVVLVLPEVDLPLLTRELVYTAMTRARRSVLLVGPQELLARAVSRSIERHSGIAERLAVSK
jgi:exodeoxyribonuclease V alpha subunit